MAKFEDIRTIQKLVWDKAEQAAHRPLLPTERSTGTRLISAALDNPSKVTELARWIGAPFTESTKPKVVWTDTGVIETAELAKARRLIAEADAAEAAKRDPKTLAGMSAGDCRNSLMEAHVGYANSPFFRRMGNTRPKVSEAAASAPGQSPQELAAKAARLPTVESDEAFRSAVSATWARGLFDHLGR